MPESLFRYVTVCLLLLTDQTLLFPQPGADARLMFYNVENLFDTYDDSLKDDNEFLPWGAMKWTRTRYVKKLDALYKTIVAAGKDGPPDVIAMCEVENRKVISDLVYRTYLSKFPYAVVHENSPDLRGIDVCLVYRKDRFRLIGYTCWIPSDTGRGAYTTRSVLYCRLASGDDTIHLVINHWPSRRGGVLAGGEMRERIAHMVRKKADSICSSTKGRAKLIIAGDFNCSPGEREIHILADDRRTGVCMENLSEYLAKKGKGTYRFQGIWEMIDQVIVSCSLTRADSGFYTGQKLLRVFDPEFLLRKDPKYPGYAPFPTYTGFRYQGGYSDHLPVLLDLCFRPRTQRE